PKGTPVPEERLDRRRARGVRPAILVSCPRGGLLLGLADRRPPPTGVEEPVVALLGERRERPRFVHGKGGRHHDVGSRSEGRRIRLFAGVDGGGSNGGAFGGTGLHPLSSRLPCAAGACRAGQRR